MRGRVGVRVGVRVRVRVVVRVRVAPVHDLVDLVRGTLGSEL